MLIEEALFTMISTSAGVTDIVGTKIYPVTVPQYVQSEQTTTPSYPALVYTLLGRKREQTHDGPVGLIESEYELSCLSTKYLETKNLANAVRLALEGKAAEMQALYTQDVAGIYLDDESDGFLFDEVEHLSLYYVPQRYVIQHREAETEES